MSPDFVTEQVTMTEIERKEDARDLYLPMITPVWIVLVVEAVDPSFLES